MKNILFYVLGKKIWNASGPNDWASEVKNGEEVDSRIVGGKKWRVVKNGNKHHLLRGDDYFAVPVTPDDGK